MKDFLLLISLFFISTFCSAQSPDLFSYQAVVRDNAGKVVPNQAVSFRLSVLKTNATGVAFYFETHNPTTDVNGLVSIMIGGGTVSSGTFSAIDWANDKYFLKVELDITGGTTYSAMGTTQLISVPYAKHAETAMRAINDSIYDGDSSQTNELQTLSISNDTVFLSNGGFAVIPDSSLLGVPKGGSGLGAGGKANLKDFDNKFNGVSRIGQGFTITELETDKDKNVYISGNFRGQMTIGSQSFTGLNSNKSEVFVAKLDSSFNLIWAKATIGASMRRSSFIADDNGNCLLVVLCDQNTASFTFDGATYNLQLNGYSGKVFKISTTGTAIWNTDYYSETSPSIIHLGLTPNSDLIMASAFRGKLKIGSDSIQFTQSLNTYGLLKLTSNGQSFSLLDSSINTFGQDVTADPAGNIYVLIASDWKHSGSVQLNGANVPIPNSLILVNYSSTGTVLNTNNTFGGWNDVSGANRPLLHDGTNLYVGFFAYDFFIGNDYYTGGHSYLLKLNSTLTIQSKTTLEAANYATPLSIAKKVNGDFALGYYMRDGYILNDVQYTLLSGSESFTGMYAEVSSSGAITKHKMLQLFKETDGIRLDATGNSVFMGCGINGSFYNKGTKYTPGVYLFKE